jgi:hypothetical protein
MDIYRILEKLAVISNKQTLTEGRVKRDLEDLARQVSKEKFVADAGEYGMGKEEAAEFWVNSNGGEEEELDEERRSEEDWDDQALAQQKAKLAREKNKMDMQRRMQNPEKYAKDNIDEAEAAGQFKTGDRVMYNNTFATIAGQDGDAYIVKVDKQPNTMKVPATAIKKPSYNEGAADGDDSVLPLLKKFISKKSDPADRQDLIKVYRAFQQGMPQGFETLSNQWGTNLDAEFYHFAKQQGVDLNSIAKKHGVLKDSVAESKKSKPDFLDMDKDGDEKEPMKKAVKDKNDAKGAFQKQMGGSAGDLTKGLSIGAKKVSENKHDLPFDVDPKEKAAKKVTPGKHGQEYSQVRHLARKGMSPDVKKSSKQDKLSESDMEDQGQVAEKKLGALRPKLGTQRDIGKSVRTWRKERGLGESSDEQSMLESDMEESALQAYLGKKKYGPEGMKALQQAGRDGAGKEKMAKIRARHDKMDEAEMDEGNKFAHNVLKAKAAGIKKADLDGDGDMEPVREMFPGTPEYELRFGKDDASSAFDKKKISTGTVYSRRYQDEPEADDDAPRAAGRPKGSKRRLGAKGPGVDSKLLKGKGGLKEGDIDIVDRGEYDREGDMALSQVHQIADAARELHAILASDDNLPEWVQSKITKALDYIDTARDYLDAEKEMDREELPEIAPIVGALAGRALAGAAGAGRVGQAVGSMAGRGIASAMNSNDEVAEKAPPGAKAERMVKHIKKGYAQDGKLSDREKGIAYATAWKAKKAGKVEEYDTSNRNTKTKKEPTLNLPTVGKQVDTKSRSREDDRPMSSTASITRKRSYMEEPTDKKDVPFDGPYRKKEDNKDQFGNKIKNVAQHAARKGLADMTTAELKAELKRRTKTDSESTDTRDQRAEKAGKRVAKDIEYDEGHKGRDDAKAEKAGKRVTKDIEYDDKKDKEKKVDETTVSGSVATGGDAPKKSKGGMQFGQGVYEGAIAESFDKKLGGILTEGMSVNVSTDDTGKKSITVNATDADADSLGNMLKMAGLFSSEGYSRTCEHCHGIHEAGACQAEQVAEELANSPDEVYADKDYMTQTLSGGLNGPKTTGQTTGPIVNQQPGRQGVMAEAERVVEQSESRLWNLYKHYEKK